MKCPHCNGSGQIDESSTDFCKSAKPGTWWITRGAITMDMQPTESGTKLLVLESKSSSGNWEPVICFLDDQYPGHKASGRCRRGGYFLWDWRKYAEQLFVYRPTDDERNAMAAKLTKDYRDLAYVPAAHDQSLSLSRTRRIQLRTQHTIT